MQQNYPNPFNPSTSIEYELAGEAEVQLAIYNSMGKKIVTLAHGCQQAGLHLATWDGLDENHVGSPSGLYFLQLSASTNNGVFKVHRKMLLAR